MAGNDYVDLFYFTHDAINAIKKKDLVGYIEKMKGNVVSDKQIKKRIVVQFKSPVSTNEGLMVHHFFI